MANSTPLNVHCSTVIKRAMQRGAEAGDALGAALDATGGNLALATTLSTSQLCEWCVAVRRRISGKAASAMNVHRIAAMPSLLNRLV